VLLSCDMATVSTVSVMSLLSQDIVVATSGGRRNDGKLESWAIIPDTVDDAKSKQYMMMA